MFQVFSQECFFGRKSFLMKTLMTWSIFFKNFTKVVFCSKNAKWSLNLTRFCVSKAENSDDQQRKNYEFSSFQVAKMSVTNAKISVTKFASKCHTNSNMGQALFHQSSSKFIAWPPFHQLSKLLPITIWRLFFYL